MKKPKTTYLPVGGKILIKPDKAADEIGGIVIPDKAKETPLTATVVAVGPGVLNAEGNRSVMQIQPGDRVMYQKYAGIQIDIDGDLHVILSESEIPLFIVMIVKENEPIKKAKHKTGSKVPRAGRR